MSRNDMQDLIRRIIQGNIKIVFLYFIAALGGLLVDVGLYALLIEAFSVHYFISGILGFIAGFVVNFWLGKTLAFRNIEASLSGYAELVGVLFISLAGLLVNQVVLIMSVEIVGTGEILAKLIAAGVGFVTNYFLRRVFIYKSLGPVDDEREIEIAE